LLLLILVVFIVDVVVDVVVVVLLQVVAVPIPHGDQEVYNDAHGKEAEGQTALPFCYKDVLNSKFKLLAGSDFISKESYFLSSPSRRFAALDYIYMFE
jgi:hypothetical protein